MGGIMSPERKQKSSDEPKGFKVPENLALAIMLFPGFLTLSISEYFAYSPKLDGVQLIAAALTATLVNLSLALGIWSLIAHRRSWTVSSITELILRPGFIVLISILSISTGALWAVADSKGWLYCLRFTERLSRADVWNSAFCGNNDLKPPQYVRVITTSGDVYHGIPAFFSEGNEERALLISSARREVRVRKAVKGGKQGDVNDEVVECLPVGTNTVDGKVLILKDQLRLVEFRSADTSKPKPYPYECDPTVPPVVAGGGK